MAGGFTNYTEDKVLEHIFTGPSWTPGVLRVALCLANPTESGTGAACFEVSDVDTNYARVLAGADWELTGTPGIVRNTSEFEFNSPSSDWGLITHFALIDSGIYGQGNMVIYGPVDPVVEIVQGSIPRFRVNAMSISLE